ncbi:MAG: radical SAM protein [Phycisphaerae bacterium]
MKNLQYPMKTGITRAPEFERKCLATHAINVGLKCGHECAYCPNGALFYTQPAFRQFGLTPSSHDYCIVDPTTPERVARDAKRLQKRGLIQLCAFSDAWAPECQSHALGRRCLQAILTEPEWTVRILTKNASVRDDFELIHRYRDRVRVGISITVTPEKGGIMAVLEPYASTIQERMLALLEARARGLRTYAMLCPLLPGIADAPEQIDRLVQFARDIGAEEIFVEPVNARGNSLKYSQGLLVKAGFVREAAALAGIRHQSAWSAYVVNLIHKVQQSVRRYSEIARLRLLLYPTRLLPGHIRQIQQDDAGVVWLGDTDDKE